MFTDSPVTPVRLEVLLDLLKKYPNGIAREMVYELLQPQTLSEGNQQTAKDTVSAALQLKLITENSKKLSLSEIFSKKKSSKDNILNAFDQNVLCSLKIEYYFSLFYSYYLGLNEKVYTRSNYDRKDWAHRFNMDVFGDKPQENPFNDTKYTGMDRWLNYVGLGWFDPDGKFQAYPYERLHRILPNLFEDSLKQEGDIFISKLGLICPELDGGNIFLQANNYQGYTIKDKQCSLGLSQALIDLHEEKVIRLTCPTDSRGWNIGLAQPSHDDTIESDRITIVEYIER